MGFPPGSIVTFHKVWILIININIKYQIFIFIQINVLIEEKIIEIYFAHEM